jgi:hypothetical protein
VSVLKFLYERQRRPGLDDSKPVDEHGSDDKALKIVTSDSAAA